MRYLNLACGNRFSFEKEWENIDFETTSKHVKKVNILLGLPYSKEYFNFIYSSHFLEHLTIEQSDFVLKEIYRVLKCNGTLRVVVPDLENICREYLYILDNIKGNEYRYEWIINELLDQLVRTDCGGGMQKIYDNLCLSDNVQIKDYIYQRVGEKCDNKCVQSNIITASKILKFNRLKMFVLKKYIKLIKCLFPKSIRDSLILNTNIGERHRWMYDKYSLKKKLEDIGFCKIKYLSYDKSEVVGFNKYLLDMNPDGSPYKGYSSLFIEGVKS